MGSMKPGTIVVSGDGYFHITDERQRDGVRELKIEALQFNHNFSEDAKEQRTGWRPEYKVGGKTYDKVDVSVPNIGVGDKIRWSDIETVVVDEISEGVYYFDSDVLVVPNKRTEIELAVAFAAGNAELDPTTKRDG